MKHYYPAIFRLKGEGLPGYTLRLPDIPGCLTMGDDIAECMEMAQDAIGVMLEGVAESDYPKPSKPNDLDLSEYPQDSFVSYVCFDKELYDAALGEREAILRAENPIRELLNRRNMKIKQLSDLLSCPYRTCQDWSLGKSRPADWVLNLILDKVLD